MDVLGNGVGFRNLIDVLRVIAICYIYRYTKVDLGS